MLHTRQAMSSSFLHSSALTWHASKEYTLVPPNAMEREMTLDKARRYHFQNSIVPLLLEEEVGADWANLVESLLAEQGTQSEYGGRCVGKWAAERLLACYSHTRADGHVLHTCSYYRSVYGTEADFESAMRMMIEISRPKKTVQCRQQFTAGKFTYDLALNEGGDVKLRPRDVSKFVIIEVKYVRKAWISMRNDGKYKLSPKHAFKTFEEHVEDAKLAERVSNAKELYPQAKCHAVFIMAIHGGLFRVCRSGSS